MANIRIDLKSEPLNGQSVVFKAPCDCTAITGIEAYYYDGSKMASKSFEFKDAHGNNVAGLGNLFAKGSYVKVILDTATNSAFIQNADNNSYVESRLVDIRSTTEDVIKNSMAGDLRVTKIVGNTVQEAPNLLNVPSQFSVTGGTNIEVNLPIGDYILTCDTISNLTRIAFKTSDGTTNTAVYLSANEISFSTTEVVTQVAIPGIMSSTGEVLTIVYNNLAIRQAAPTPEKPIPMYHTSDVVEMIQGAYAYATGLLANSVNYVCNKHTIPCKQGDEVLIKTENEMTQCGLIYYNNGERIGVDYTRYDNQSLKEWSFTVPSGVTHFNFNLRNTNITPSTVGKITLQINGKYVGGIECTHNLVKHVESGGLESGTGVESASSTYFRTSYCKVKPNSKVYVYGYDEDNQYLRIFFYDENKGYIKDLLVQNHFNVDIPSNCHYVRVHLNKNNPNYMNIVISEVPKDLYHEPIKVYFLMNEPLRLGDVVFKDTDGLWKVERNTTEIVFDSTTPNNHISYADLDSGVFFFYRDMSNLEPIACDSFSKFPSKGITWNGNVSLLNDEQFSKRYGDTQDRLYFRHSGFTSIDDVMAYLQTNSITFLCETTTPIIETLDTESQLALHGLKTFDGVTYIEVDSRVKPSEFEAEYGATQVGVEVLELSKHKNDIQYVDVRFDGEVSTATKITPPPGFNIYNSVVIAYDFFDDGNTSNIFHNYVPALDLIDNQTFLAHLTFMKNVKNNNFVIFSGQLDSFSDQADVIRFSLTGTLRIYFQRIS